MKKIVYISLFALLFAGCNQDDDVVSGIAVAFYPETTAEIEEEDGVTYTIQLEATGSIGTQPASVEIMVQSSVEGTLLITDASGSPLEINNNTFSISFQQDTVESGNGPRVQALASFGVQALNDVIPTNYDAEFVIVGTGGAINSISSTNVFTLQVEDTDTAPIFEDDFENGLGNWTIIDLDGNNTWGETAFDGNTSALSSTFNSASPADEDNWLISPVINFDSFGSETLTFLSKTRFNDESNRLEVSVLQNFDGSDPLAAQQTLLNPTLDPHTGGGFGDFTESGDLDLSNISGSGHIAFRFKAVNASDGSGWEVDDVLLSIFDPDASGGGTDNLINLPYSEDFENCTQDFGTPNGFIEAFAAGAKTDRGWGCRQEGVDDSRGVRASGFGG
ncbi:MAG: choice-of-anchor J domain-containing protein, partial [Bacteroidota bacterium]